MTKRDLRQKVIRQLKNFEITEAEIDELIKKGDFNYNPERDPYSTEPYVSIKNMIEGFSEHKRYNLMCLMYLGRNISYYGFGELAVDDFCFYADKWKKDMPDDQKLPYGSTDPAYLAGKKHISRWLKLVKSEVQIQK